MVVPTIIITDLIFIYFVAIPPQDYLAAGVCACKNQDVDRVRRQRQLQAGETSAQTDCNLLDQWPPDQQVVRQSVVDQ